MVTSCKNSIPSLRDNRLWKKITAQGTTQYAITYEYSDNGGLASLETSRNGVPGTKVAYKYDSLSRLKTATHDPSGTPKTTTYDYDPAGNLESCLYPNAVRTSYAYNSLNLLRRMGSAIGSTPVANFDYDEAGEVVEPATARASWGSRLLSPSGRRNRLVERISNAAQSLTRTIDYDYDKLNRLTQEILGSGSIRYDGLTPMGGTGSPMNPYDKVGNRRSRRSTVSPVAPTPSNVAFDHNDRLDNDTDPATSSPYFDANGNTLKPDLNGDGIIDANENAYTYSYDFENHFIGATGGGKTISIVYDGDGNRVKRTVNGVETRYLVDDQNLTGHAQVLEERDSAGNTLASYVYGLDLVSQKRGAATHYYGYDGLGTVRYLTYQDGHVSDTYTFDAFGIMIERRARRDTDGVLVAFADPASETGPAGTQPTVNWYRYTGEQFDPDLGLYYLRARYYSPQIGRFWTMDTFEGDQEDPLSLHKYLYAGANPVNAVDPSGQMSSIEVGIASTIATALEFVYNELVSEVGWALLDKAEEMLDRAYVMDLQADFAEAALVTQAGGDPYMLLDAESLDKMAASEGWQLSAEEEAQFSAAREEEDEGIIPGAIPKARIANQVSGIAREKYVYKKLQAKFPKAEILQQAYVRDAKGKVIRQPSGRRLDFAVIEGGKVRFVIEVTSKTADKGNQAYTEKFQAKHYDCHLKSKLTGRLAKLPASGRGIFRGGFSRLSRRL